MTCYLLERIKYHQMTSVHCMNPLKFYHPLWCRFLEHIPSKEQLFCKEFLHLLVKETWMVQLATVFQIFQIAPSKWTTWNTTTCKLLNTETPTSSVLRFSFIAPVCPTANADSRRCIGKFRTRTDAPSTSVPFLNLGFSQKQFQSSTEFFESSAESPAAN